MSDTIKKQIQTLLAEATAKIEAAMKLADEHKTSFYFDVTYGMGGTYEGDPANRNGEDDGWQPSSHSC